jgi:hypothetical protein
MTSRRLPKFFLLTSPRWTFFQMSAVLVMFAAFGPAMHAQVLLASAPLLDAPTPSAESALPPAITPVAFTPAFVTSNVHPEHKFFDTQNRVLLIASAALNGADFAVTRANLQGGGQELNPIVRVFGRSTPGLAVNFAGETASVIGLGYFFHKIGHHKLERAVFLVNIGSSAGAVTYGMTHR